MARTAHIALKALPRKDDDRDRHMTDDLNAMGDEK